MLHNRFVCGYRDIGGERYAGNSGAHTTSGQAVETTNGAGPHNIQLFVLDPDGTVLHCLPGYWNPKDLASELQLAEKLDGVWRNGSLSAQQKNALFQSMQMEHFRQHPQETTARSQMQNFDRKHELARGYTDTVRTAPNPNALHWKDGGDDLVKTTDEIMHERMSKRPFVAYSSFDTGNFVDYGTHFYDKHEDSLSQDGRRGEKKVGPKRLETMNDIRNNHYGQKQAAGGHVPRIQIKTYGQLRR